MSRDGFTATETGGAELVSFPSNPNSGRAFVENLIIKGASKEFITNLLFLKVQKGDFNGMMACLQYGANVNGTHGQNRQTAAMAAVKLGRKDILKALIDFGACVDPVWVRVACESNQPEMLRYLQSIGLSLEFSGPHSPATFAVVRGNLQCVKFLSKSGVDVSKPDPDGSTPMFAAANFGRIECLKYLASLGADLNHQTAVGNTAVFAAAEFGHTACLKFLIDAGADVNLCNKNGVSPTFIATSKNRSECLKCLADAGVDLDQEINSFTLAIVAAGRGSLDCLKILIDRGVQIDNPSSSTPFTAAHCAAQLGRLDSIRLLASHGADLGIRAPDGSTPAHFAASSGHKHILKYLSERREDLFTKDDRGRTPLFLASQNKKTQCVVFIQRHRQDLIRACEAEIQFILQSCNQSQRGAILPD